MISCPIYTARLTGSWLYLYFLQLGFVATMMGFPTISHTQTFIRFMGVGSKAAGQRAAPDMVIKKHVPHCILNPDCLSVVNHATTVLSQNVHMNFCLHSTKRTVKNTDSHAQRKMQCEHWTSGLQDTVGTTAIMHILNETGGCQLNNTLNKCHGALWQLLHSNVLGQPHARVR
jgi:hypothetical protein